MAFAVAMGCVVVGLVLPTTAPPPVPMAAPVRLARPLMMAASNVRAKFAEDLKQMGSMGAYFAVREQMVQAFNGGEGAEERTYLTLEELPTVMAALDEPDLDEAELLALFDEADAINPSMPGKITYEAFTKAFCDSAKRAAAGDGGEEKKFFGLF